MFGKMKKGMFALGAAMLWCASAWAMLPVEGVYEKVDENGNVVARLQVWNAYGSVGREGQKWSNSSGAPYISLQRFENGAEVVQLGTCYIWKNDSVGAAETAVLLNKEDCDKAKNNEDFVGQRKRDVAAFSWKSEQLVDVGAFNFDAKLSGNYKRVNKARQLTPAVLMYAYEHNQRPPVYYADALVPDYTDGALPKLAYSFVSMNGPIPMKQFNIKNKAEQWEMEFYAENDFNLVMEADGKYKKDYYFPFVHKEFLKRTENTWGDTNIEGTMSEAAAMSILRRLHTNDTYIPLRPDATGCLTFTDFFSGEGPNAKSSFAFKSNQSLMDLGWLTKGTIYLSDDGAFTTYRNSGPAMVQGTDIRFRDRADGNSNIIGVMQDGEKVQCLGYVAGADRNWAYIERNNGERGFMAFQYLRGVEQP